MYNNKEEKLYLVVDFSRQPVHTACVKAMSKSDAADGFRSIYRNVKISNITEIPISNKEELDNLPDMQRELINKALEDYIYFNPFRGCWRRELNRGGDNRNILNIQPGSTSGRRLILYFVNLSFQSEKAEVLVDYLTNIEKVNMNDVCYSTYDYRRADGTLNLIPAEYSSEYYDSFGFVFDSVQCKDIGAIHSLYSSREKKPAIYILTNNGNVIEVNRSYEKRKETLLNAYC